MHGVIARLSDFFAALVDIIAPRRAHTLRSLSLGPTDIPLNPASHHLLGIDITTLLDYRDARVRAIIQSLKYEGSQHSASVCAAILADYLHEELSISRAFGPRRIVLMSVPLHISRTRERGFNQVDRVLDHLPPDIKQLVATDALVRTKATEQQAKLHRNDRIKNMLDAFAVPDTNTVRNTHIYLIDDVTTTGATLKSATKTLEASGAVVVPIALARA